MSERTGSRSDVQAAKGAPHDWREFERLVGRIEEMACPLGAIVRSPDRVRDLTTGRLREVDASIRYRVGTTDLLITIECRKRSRRADDTWIEQLATKKSKIGAAKTIAVSSSGFSQSAIETAERFGIEIRVLSEVSQVDMQRWLADRPFMLHTRILSNIAVTAVSWGVDSEAGKRQLTMECHDPFEPSFHAEFIDSPFPPVALLFLYERAYPERFADVPLDGTVKPVVANITWRHGELLLGDIPIRLVRITADCHYENEVTDNGIHVRYAKPGNCAIEHSVYESQSGCRLHLQSEAASEGTQVSYEFSPDLPITPLDAGRILHWDEETGAWTRGLRPVTGSPLKDDTLTMHDVFFKYRHERLSLTEDAPLPRYQQILDWMRAMPNRAISFDIWARGNYMLRLIDNLRRNVCPLVVPVSSVTQIVWAYRRLALIGLPVEFIYTGGVSKPQRVLDLYPADGLITGGAGYIGALGRSDEDLPTFHGKKWFVVTGYSRLMPEGLLDWIVNEAHDPFLRGEVFVAPAELVGVHPVQPVSGMRALEEVVGGRGFADATYATKALMDLELPYLDHMSSTAFQQFLADHENELVRFRTVFRRLAGGVPAKDLEDVVEELKSEVAEMSLSHHYASLRKSISALGGAMVTLSAAVAACAAASPDTALPVAAGAGCAAATAVLADLWKQRIDAEAEARRNPYFIMWKLGMDKPTTVRRGPVDAEIQRWQRVFDAGEANLDALHWLCGPGMGIVGSPQPIRVEGTADTE